MYLNGYLILLGAALAGIPQSAGQTSGGQSIEGQVLADDGRPVADAVVSVIGLPSPDAGTRPPHVPAVRADASGRFRVTGMAPAAYRLCAQKPFTEFLSPCEWQTARADIQLRVGETRKGIVLEMRRGHLLDVRFDDADELLDRHIGKTKGTTLMLAVERPGQPALFVPAESRDKKRLRYAVAVPFDTDLRLLVIGTKFEIEDEQGRAVDARSSIPFRAAKAQAARPVVFKVKRLKP